MPSIDFTADEEESPKIDFTPDPTPAVAQAPQPIIPPDENLIAQSEKKADLFAAQQKARQQGEYWQGVADRIDKLTGTTVEPLSRGVAGTFGRAADAAVNLITGRPQVSPGQRGLTEAALEAPTINLPKAGEAETPLGKAAAGTYNAAADLIAGFSSPNALLTLPAGVNKTVLSGWISQMAGNAPGRVIKAHQLFKEGKPQEAWQEIATGVGETGMAVAGGRHLVREPGISTRADVRPDIIDPRAAQDIALQLTDPRYAQRQVVMPESVRELAKEPSTTGAPNAIQERQAAETIRGLPEQSAVNEPLPAEKGGREVPPGGVPPGDEIGAPRAEEARKPEVPLNEAPSPLPKQFHDKPVAETTDLVKGVTSEDLAAYKGKAGAGATGFMWDLGAKAKTAEDVAALRKIGEDASAETKALMKAGDTMGAMKVIGRQPAEAYEYATGVKLDGTPKWEVLEKMAAMKGQTYKPPVPDPQYLKAKGETAAAPEPAKAAPAEINLKDRPVTEAEKANEMYMESNWTHVEDVTDAQGNTIGKIRGNATPGLFQVKGANIVKSQQGKGTYQKVIRQLAEKYGTVQSDTDMQPAAEAAWEKVGAQIQPDGSYNLSSYLNLNRAKHVLDQPATSTPTVQIAQN